MSIEVHRLAFEAIISRLKNSGNFSHPLRVIDLSWKGLDDSHAIQLADCLKRGSPVIRLRLQSNEIGNDGTIAIAKVLQGTVDETKLRYLILSDNKIGLEGAIEISKGLINNRSLRHLDLSRNSLKDAGVSYILNATTNNTSLVTLDLSFNEITDDCSAIVASVVRSNNKLRCVRLSDNLLSDAGAKVIYEALRDNTKIQELDLDGNNVSQDIVQSMKKIYRKERRPITRR
jgi:Ran GTPase-activating protein (RanGAP) involved in mRNA processing and transport